MYMGRCHSRERCIALRPQAQRSSSRPAFFLNGQINSIKPKIATYLFHNSNTPLGSAPHCGFKGTGLAWNPLVIIAGYTLALDPASGPFSSS